MPIHAPYNFVTLSRFIYAPDWADRISHDVPFSDGVSGEFDITITAHSKILIGGERGEDDGIQTVEPFKLPDGAYAIPESSLRGMIRNVLEIAAFGRMQFVDDKRFGVRDLTPAAKPFYRDQIVGKVRAGWLSFDPAQQGWIIDECEFVRIEHSDLSAWQPDFGARLNRIKGEQQQAERFARKLYDAWGGRPLECDLWVDNGIARPPIAGVPNSKAIAKRGTLVFTGQPMKWTEEDLAYGATRKKHLEFVFLQAPGTRHVLSPKVWADFLTIHEGQEQTNDNWMFWRDRFKAGACLSIPVFFLCDADLSVKSLGLAMMFKLAYQHSVHDMVRHTRKNHLEDRMDLPTAIFGEAAEESEANDKRKKGLKSRVNMGLARCTHLPDAAAEQEVTILAGPKPSYYPNYVRQGAPNAGVLKGTVYATYTSTNGPVERSNPEIRGWKRYPAGRTDQAPPVPGNNNNLKVQVTLRPLPAETRFTSRVRFHNVRPIELGALLWALEWGGSEGLRHRLGMGKPYGYGQISIAVDDANWSLRPNKPGQSPLWKEAYMEEFIDEMRTQYRNAASDAGHSGCTWAKSEQMIQLRAMADPGVGRKETLEYMQLEMDGPNQFEIAKESNGLNSPQVLETYPKADYPQPSDHMIWPLRGQEVENSSPIPAAWAGLTKEEQARRLSALKRSDD